VEGLSLNAIAKELGMTGPALYRYVTSRDELLVDLVVDAWEKPAELGGET
jgi:AcrR family transcriptional regulator